MQTAGVVEEKTTVRPELAVAELARVTRSRGRVLVVDQIAPVDPLTAAELNRFEHARDPSHTRTLADVDLRGKWVLKGEPALVRPAKQRHSLLEKMKDIFG